MNSGRTTQKWLILPVGVPLVATRICCIACAYGLILYALSCVTAPEELAQRVEDGRTVSYDQSIEVPSHEAPEWSVALFLKAEALRMNGDDSRAIIHYCELINASTRSSGRLTALTGIALWRILRDSESIEICDTDVFDIADYVLATGSIVRRFLSVIQVQYTGTTLSEFEMQIWRSLAAIAWNAENQDRSRATVYLFSSGASLHQDAYNLRNEVQSALDERGLTQQERLKIDELAQLYGFENRKFYGVQTDEVGLWTAKDLVSLRRFSAAVSFLRDAFESQDATVRFKAAMRLAALGPRVGMSKNERISLLTSALEDARSADDSIAIQDVLVERALVHDSEPDRSFRDSISDLFSVVTEFPRSASSSKALYLMGRFYEWENNYDQALVYYQRAAEHINERGHNEWRESTLFRASLMRYVNNDRVGAIRNLETLEDVLGQRKDRGVGSPFLSAMLFWLGRMHGEKGRQEESEEYFEKVIQESPFTFYAIRAQMYLNDGPDSSAREWPGYQATVSLRAAYQNVANFGSEYQSSDPYLQRVWWSLQNGLYRDTFRRSQLLFSNSTVLFGSRDPHYLSQTNRLVPLVIWHSLRHDLLASRGLKNSPQDRILIARALEDTGDVSTALTVLAYFGLDLRYQGYLAALYPIVFRNEILDVLDDSPVVRPELLYAIMREESRFARGATSSTGAIGLFQFQPETFFDLDDRLGLLDTAPGRDVEDYLRNKELSIRLGARWFEEILGRHNGDLVLSIMEHHAGYERVSGWFSTEGGWNEGGRYLNDLEVKVEMARQPATRVFLRRVLTSAWISYAAKLFSGVASEGD